MKMARIVYLAIRTVCKILKSLGTLCGQGDRTTEGIIIDEGIRAAAAVITVQRSFASQLTAYNLF